MKMPYFFRNSLICLVIILIPISSSAMINMSDADIVITMRDGLPCFSYPQDNKKLQNMPHSFGSLSISKANPFSGGGWAVSIATPDRKGLLEPNSPVTCIKYGVLHPGTKNIRPAEQPLLMDTPYKVFIGVDSISKNLSYSLNFLSFFCVVRDAKGNTIVVGADSDPKADGMKCLKPSESPKHGFWQRLFGR